jgi:hypothetical protein
MRTLAGKAIIAVPAAILLSNRTTSLQRFERQAINVSRGGHDQVESTRVGASKISSPTRRSAPVTVFWLKGFKRLCILVL